MTPRSGSLCLRRISSRNLVFTFYLNAIVFCQFQLEIYVSSDKKALLPFRQVLTWKNNLLPAHSITVSAAVSGGAERGKTFGLRRRLRLRRGGDFINVVRSAAPCSHALHSVECTSAGTIPQLLNHCKRIDSLFMKEFIPDQ